MAKPFLQWIFVIDNKKHHVNCRITLKQHPEHAVYALDYCSMLKQQVYAQCLGVVLQRIF